MAAAARVCLAGGEIEAGALLAAFAALVRRHPALRTAFVQLPSGEPVQRVHEELPPEVGREEVAGEEELAERLAVEAARPFDLANGPLLRARLFVVPGADPVLLLTVHHLATDFASLALLTHELGVLAAGRALPPPPALTPADWALRERQRLAGPRSAELLAAWSARLAGAPDLDLPTDRPRPAALSGAGGSIALRLPGEVAAGARELARRHSATLFMTLLAAFQALLARRGGQTDFVVGVPTTGRLDPDLTAVVGCFADALPVRADLTGDPTVPELLRRVRRTTFEAFALQEIPFAWLAEHLRPGRDARRPPVFQVSFLMPAAQSPEEAALAAFTLGLPGIRLRSGGLELESVPLPRSAARLELALTLAEVDGTLGLCLDYAADLFDRGTVERLAWDLGQLLEGMAASPERRLAEIPLLSAAERDQAAAAPVPPLRRRTRREPPPLSFAQQRLWLLDRLEPGRATYNIPAAVRLQGELEPRVLEASLAEVVRRHEALRTRFAETGDGPVQILEKETPRSLPRVDLTALPATVRAGELQEILQREADTPFDLARGPVLRAWLALLEPGAAILALNLHHIAGDGWSMGVLVREVGILYAAFAAGLPSPLAEPPVQPADHAVWEREWLQGEVLASQLAWWRQRLEGLRPLDLPADRPLPARRAGGGGRVPLHLPADLVAALTALAQQRGLTLFMVLLAALQVLLARRSGQGDLAVGSPVAHRTRREIEGLIGFFVNTLVLRTDLSDDPAVPDLLERARATALGALAHQDLPFEKLVEELQPERALTTTPFFRVLLALQNAPMPELSLGSLRLLPLDVATRTAKLDLSVSLSPAPGGGLAGHLEHATDLFDHATVERIGGHLRQILGGLAGETHRRISDLPLLTAVEQEQLTAWSGEGVPALPDGAATLHEAFRRQAARTPEAVALIDGSERWTYRALAQRASRLAHRLRALGVGPEVVVGLLLGRDAAAVAALLGVLEAGGAYLPLDPSHPAERLGFLATDARARLLLTGERWRAALPAGVPGVLLEELESGEEESPSGDGGAVAASLAYVVYTSGSTGRPKGVGVTHGSALAFLAWAATAFSREELAGVLASTSFGFDLSVFEIFAPLTQGGTAILAPDALALPDLPWAGEVTLVNTVPSAAAELVRQGAIPSSVRTVALGGEAFPAALARRLGDLPGVRRRLNLYGPSEDTVYSTWAEVAAGSDAPPPIGRPLPGTCVRVLDRSLRPVPAGVPGELCLGGAGLARGYLFRPELTAERFVPDPDASAEHPGARLYRTGDLVRFRADGALEFLGRLDHQVKIRGFRVELGEIETALTAHPGVREAAVVAHARGAGREDEPGDRILVAFHVPEAAEEPAPADLRAWLARRLPEPVIPGVFLSLPALPLNTNGKVDRAALMALTGLETGPTAPSRAPRTQMEELLAGLWAEILGRERVGLDDDFFALGGHSLLATRVASRLRADLGVDLPVAELFAAPTVAALAPRVEAALRSGLAHPPPPLRRAPRGRPLPASFAQQRLWFLDRLGPSRRTAYNLPAAVRLRGPLEGAALERSLAEIVLRHEALRTRFAAGEEGPVQVIDDLSPLAVPVFDLRGLPQALQEAELARLAQEEADRPFDLERGPVIRTWRADLAPEEAFLLVNIHHVASDGWSTGVLLRELGMLYEAFAAGRPSPLPPRPIQPADYAVWQRSWLRGEALAERLAWWRERLAGARPLELPADRPEPPVRTFRAGRIDLEIPADLGQRVAALAARRQATPFLVLLAALQALLARSESHGDITVGTPLANRLHPEIEGAIGFFVNTLPLRTVLEDDPDGGALLSRCREVALGAAAHQEVPFEKLVEELQPERSVGALPFFRVLFAFQNTPRLELVFGGLTLEPVDVAPSTAKLDLALSLRPEGDTFTGSLEYAADRFDRPTVQRLAGHLVTLLGGLIADPAARLAELPLLAPAERAQIVVEWNDTRVEPRGELFHQMFEEQARRTPEAIALFGSRGSLTYAGLDREAERLARALRSRGVGPDRIVGLFLEKSFDVVTAVFAILKAGGGYLLLDPAHPDARLAALADDAGIALLLTRERLASRLPLPVPTLCVESLGDAPDTPAVPGHPEQVAYVLYTSGSTGHPKGVMVTHRGLCNTARATVQAIGQEPGRRVLQFFSWSFDASVFEICMTLLSGGTLCLPEEERLLGADLVRRVEDWRIDALSLPPSVLAGLSPGEMTGLRLLTVLGEACSQELAARWQREGRRLFNAYGPTETSIYVTGAVLDGTRRPPIGRPLPGTTVYLLDRQMRPVPLGVPGELYAGGIAPARGYSGRPDLTAERFVPDPLSAEPGARLYRTGDLARWLTDGQIDYLGRLDHQVKIRGIRIEPGEVEAALTAHPGVREAAVVVRAAEDPGERVLVAFFVPAGGETPGAGALRDGLARTLPRAALPSVYVALEALPRTTSGKLDRRALALQAPAPEPTDEGSAAPRTPAEELMAGIWADLLGGVRVGTGDDFFTLGGHSLLAARLAARVREVFEVDLPLAEVFASPTVAGLAAAVEAARRGAAPRDDAPPLRPVPRDGAGLPLSFAQERLWFLDRLEPGGSAYNMASAVRLRGGVDRRALAGSLEMVARRHEILRATFGLAGSRPVQRIAPPAPVPLPLVDLSVLPAAVGQEEALRLARGEAHLPFDLEAGPLLRARLLRLADGDEGEHILLLTLHHIACDGWSLGVLVRELGTAYRALAAGTVPWLPPLPVQYADYAAWQRSWLQGEALEARLGFWRRQLAGLETLQLPTDAPLPAVQAPRGARARLALSPAATAALGSLARRHGATPFMVLLAAFQLLLQRWTGQDDLAVGTPIANRVRPELEGLVGLFLNNLVLRADLTGDPPFSGLLRRVRRTALEAYAHQDLPFERLVEALRPRRDLSRHPLFDILLNGVDTPASPALDDGLFEPVDLPDLEAKFALTLYAAHQGGTLRLELLYQKALFSAARMAHLLHQLAALLEQVAADPERPLSAYSLLTPEAREILADPAAPLEAPPYPSLPALFARQAERMPELPAVLQGGASWSYAELEARSRELALWLRREGIGTGVVAAVSGNRSFGLVAAALAVLRAGGVLLLLDPRLPEERRRLMLRTARAALLLQAGEWTAGQGLAGDLPEPEPDDPAYLFFTSGTTGAPKGVLGRHRGLAHFLAWQSAEFAVGPGDRAAQLTGLSFDVVLRDLFLPLVSGATLCLPEPEDESGPERLLPWMERQGITLLHTVPALARAWLARVPAGVTLRTLRQVFFAGEPLTGELVRQWRRAFPQAGEIANLYGPTETTLAKCCFRVPAEPLPGIQPVGRPLPHTQALVQGPGGRRCGLYEPGEIVLRTPFRSLGYINDPAGQAERFVPNPDSPEGADDLLYRTGDRGRWRADGVLEILGRADHQVKVRGVRVEPREVEAELAAHPEIREAVVRAWTDGGETSLVAYLVPRGERPLPAGELRRFLGARLPEPMIPGVFLVLDRLPLTANGKVDLAALPAPDGARPLLETAYEPPRSELERTLAAAWREVLGLEEVGVHDNFFELGGHSLLLVRLQGRLRDLLGRDIQVVDLFRHPSIGALARHLGTREAGPSDVELSGRRAELRRARRNRRQPARVAGGGTAQDDGDDDEDF